MIIGALGDAHGRKFLGLVKDLKGQLAGVDLLLLAGDITDGNDLDQYGYVLDRLGRFTSAPMVAVFGNDEYEQDHEEYRKRFTGVTFLEDSSTDLDIDGTRVRVVGTTGSLDRPTWWQRTNVPNIWNRYRSRVDAVSRLLSKEGADLVVLLSHYAPTYLTLKGEREKAFPEMGSQLLERVLLERRPDLVVHAHAHQGTVRATLVKRQTSLDDLGEVGKVSIYNVSLPLTRKITRFEVTRTDGASVRPKD